MLIRYSLAAKALATCLVASPAYAPTLAPMVQTTVAQPAAGATLPAPPLAR